MEKKISVIIPNYNGSDLLAKNLPSVVKNCPNCEIIVVDDASTDNSVNLIHKKFKKVKLVKIVKNVGFAKAVNIGAAGANGELVVLLNSDVSPRENFLQAATNHFKDKNLFAVALCDLSHEGSRVIPRGRGGASFKRGFINHFPAFIERGRTFWVSGGAGLFDRKKFLNLGGFDSIFAPFYWEDIDLSFKAWRSGFTCVFEPLSKVDHFHESGTIRKSRSRFFIKSVSYKNQFIFVWKNINDYFLIAQHILWQPYHIARAILRFDLAFFAGLTWAVFKIPDLIIDSSLTRPERSRRITHHPSLSEREVLKKFEE